jgi:hypothetical protein
MGVISGFFDWFTKLSTDHLNGLIALAGLGLAAFAIFAVLAVVKEQRRR